MCQLRPPGSGVVLAFVSFYHLHKVLRGNGYSVSGLVGYIAYVKVCRSGDWRVNLLTPDKWNVHVGMGQYLPAMVLWFKEPQNKFGLISPGAALTPNRHKALMAWCRNNAAYCPERGQWVVDIDALDEHGQRADPSAPKPRYKREARLEQLLVEQGYA